MKLDFYCSTVYKQSTVATERISADETKTICAARRQDSERRVKDRTQVLV